MERRKCYILVKDDWQLYRMKLHDNTVDFTTSQKMHRWGRTGRHLTTIGVGQVI